VNNHWIRWASVAKTMFSGSVRFAGVVPQHLIHSPFSKDAMPSGRFAATIGALMIAVLLLTGCTPEIQRADRTESPVATPSAPSPSPAPSIGSSATVTGPSVRVFETPDGAVMSTLGNPQAQGAPLTFLVVRTQGKWIQVRVPQRPNGSTGWILASSVTLANLSYSLQVSVASKTLSLYNNDVLVKTYPVATGTGGTPTPLGNFFLTELLAPTNSGYGPFAFGLSAFSEVLSSFGGGPGQIGLHGTDDAASIGQSASHGCIRMSNDAITALAKLLPLGTPISIT
jgi:lipoprotein-anchoring transpeptidase ErfK/SrfK